MATKLPQEDPSEGIQQDLKMVDSSTKFTSLILVAVGLGVLLVAVTITLAVVLGSSTSEIPRGLQMIPRADPITYTKGDDNSIKSFTEEISNFLAEYDHTPDETFIECNDTVRPKGEEVCMRKPSILKACRSSLSFGFESFSPCVLLMLHLEESFKPEPYQRLEELPDDFPGDLRRDVEGSMKDGKLLQGVWVDCSSNVNLLDPQSIFPDYFFDNIGAKEYMPPFVAVQFDLSDKINKTVNIECKAWAKNIDHNIHHFSKVSFKLHVKEAV